MNVDKVPFFKLLFILQKMFFVIPGKMMRFPGTRKKQSTFFTVMFVLQFIIFFKDGCS